MTKQLHISCRSKDFPLHMAELILRSLTADRQPPLSDHITMAQDALCLSYCATMNNNQQIQKDQ